MNRDKLALVPRSVPTLLRMAQAPERDAGDARNFDADRALLDAVAQENVLLRGELDSLKETVRNLTKRVAYLEGAMPV